jgi:hypothetical protein
LSRAAITSPTSFVTFTDTRPLLRIYRVLQLSKLNYILMCVIPSQ